MSQNIRDIVVPDEDRKVLERIKTRLYDGQVLTYDERTDLAKAIEGVLQRAWTRCYTCGDHDCPSCRDDGPVVESESEAYACVMDIGAMAAQMTGNPAAEKEYRQAGKKALKEGLSKTSKPLKAK
jgi:Ribonuclease G/E